MPRLQHILVPVDFTEKNQSALDMATQLGVENDARLTLLHVIETIDYATDDELDQFYGTLQERSQEQMRSLVKQLAPRGVTVEVQTVMGNRARSIASYAAQHEIDLVVISSHQIKPDDDPRGWATISYQVSILSPCSVLLVK